ncbi:hypothetical protein PspKH34_32340 [Parageobacillus sp. KH3-4]|nr:hypothetical protein PspKH34_32340 [Parageobacillus sp. KH3-4]
MNLFNSRGRTEILPKSVVREMQHGWLTDSIVQLTALVILLWAVFLLIENRQ